LVAWSAFVWAANAQAADASTLRLTLLVAMVLIFVAGLAIPGAFGGNATLFVATYASVRVLHLALYADASRRGNASWSAIVGFAVTVAVGMALLLAGSFLEGPARRCRTAPGLRCETGSRSICSATPRSACA
jgi:low temperature requirement protein LtrA